ncbi:MULTISPECIES: 3'-5' exonuclease [unclassified Meiothermus]|uniref:3'-5' exonuclease n=1 Tax=unclassified Meiothermus TaxID=370471 RepID=UPI000D7BC12B|nr:MULTISPECIES: 3'-5' exonuclease [unclassified Meiothermus]PZA06082.1 DNA helicase UvrD [Meiothermus sp. Pnk-1]RYM36178.1 DNA helicase UvrD [Meiothermus sp. PNK-Is4]
MGTPVIGLSESFWKARKALTPEEQSLVDHSLMKFMENPEHPGLRLHRLDALPKSKAKVLWSLRVNDDIRMILYRHETGWIPVYVDHHDPAYDWARRHEVEVNAKTGELQIYRTIEQVKVVTREVRPVLAGHSREYLLDLGVPESYVDPLLMAEEGQFEELISGLSALVQERLLELATGRLVPVPPRLRTIEELANHPLGRQQLLFLRNLEELKRALSYPWEQWMVFLHPAQREVVEQTFRGPARVTGSAGTGKTVVVVHRAKVLAERYPEEPILVTTFNRFLAARLRRALEQLMGQLPPNLEVENLHALAHRLYGKLGGTAKLIPETDAIFRELLHTHTQSLGFPYAFLLSEHALLDSHGLYTWEAYRSFPRVGRGVPLTARQRLALFQVFQAFWQDLEAQGFLTFQRLLHEVRKGVEEGKLPRYRAILVDETQDFGPAELLLVKSLAPVEEDGLFFALDPAQRIYRSPLPWQALGLDIRGRSRRLKVNYRSTRQVVGLAERILPKKLEEEQREVLSLLQGPEPEVRGFTREEEALEELARWIRWLLGLGCEPREIAVFARVRELVRKLADYLNHRDIPAGAAEESEVEGVYCSTAHGGKGLEFRAVALFGAQKGLFPLESLLRDLEGEERAVQEEKERHLLYVALSRAREHLWVGYVGEPSPFLGGEG